MPDEAPQMNALIERAGLRLRRTMSCMSCDRDRHLEKAVIHPVQRFHTNDAFMPMPKGLSRSE